MGREWTGTSNNEPYARLYYIVDGEAEIWHHREQFVFIPGQLYLIPPKSRMRFRCQNRFTVTWVHFNIFLYGYIDLFETQSFSFVHIPEDTEAVKNDMLELISLLDQGDMFSQLRSKGVLFKLVSNFFKFQPEKRLPQDQEKINRLKPVLDYIEKHLGEQIKLA